MMQEFTCDMAMRTCWGDTRHTPHSCGYNHFDDYSDSYRAYLFPLTEDEVPLNLFPTKFIAAFHY